MAVGALRARESVSCLLRELGRVHRFELELGLACLQPSEVEEAFYEAAQAVTLAVQERVVGLLVFIARDAAALEEF